MFYTIINVDGLFKESHMWLPPKRFDLQFHEFWLTSFLSEMFPINLLDPLWLPSLRLIWLSGVYEMNCCSGDYRPAPHPAALLEGLKAEEPTNALFLKARFMGPTWGRQDPGGPHVGPMNLAIWGSFKMTWYEFLKLGPFAKPETCKNVLSLVNLYFCWAWWTCENLTTLIMSKAIIGAEAQH